MKCRIGVYISEQMAARLSAAAGRPAASKSAFVEAALAQFFGDHDSAEIALDGRLSLMSRQLEQLSCDLRIVSEVVALMARYQLAVTPALPSATLPEACGLGCQRFDELVSQVTRRVHLGSTLIGETIERLASGQHPPADPFRHREAKTFPHEPDVRTSTAAALRGERTAAAGEGGKLPALPGGTAIPLNCERRVANGEDDCEGLSPTGCSSKASRPFRGLLAGSNLILRVFLPFAAVYCLAFFFRNINATIASYLTSEFGLTPSGLGLLTSVYYLSFAAAVLPIGILLDRCGPRRVQSIVLAAAALGASLFAIADTYLALLGGRALIGLGVAASMAAGMKALVVWFPRRHVPLLSGVMVSLGGLGGISATLPADVMIGGFGWRGLFELLAIASAGCALLIYLVVPDMPALTSAGERVPNGLKSIFFDRRFWRIAPLSAACIGTAWALQGLWVAPWLSDVEGLGRAGLLLHLFLMAIALSVGALVLGIAAEPLRRRGVGPQMLFVLVPATFIVAQLSLILRWPMPSFVPWAVIAAVGATTVLSYAVLADYFPKELAGRANAALNAFHIGVAFVLQVVTGVVVQLWPCLEGHYPKIAYQTAFALNLGLQIAAAIWFALPWLLKMLGWRPRQRAEA